MIAITATVMWWAAESGIDEVETIRPAAGVTAVDTDLAAGTVNLAAGEHLLIDVERRAGRFAGTPSVTSTVADADGPAGDRHLPDHRRR